MSFASLLTSKCFEYLLQEETSLLPQQAAPLLPPWTFTEQFRARCTGCNACSAACPTHIIISGNDGFPIVDFTQGHCTFCGNCTQSCPTGALQFTPEQAPWHLVVHIAATCLLRQQMLCLTCVEQCEQGAIRLPQTEGQLPQITPAQCNGCGACCRPCPVGAISLVSIKDGA